LFVYPIKVIQVSK